MARRLGLSLLALGALAFLVSAASAGPHGHSMRGGTLNLTWGAQPDSLDPALARGYVGSWSLLFATCSKLFMTVPDPDTGRPLKVAHLEVTDRAVCPACTQLGAGGYVSFVSDMRLAFACPACRKLIWAPGA